MQLFTRFVVLTLLALSVHAAIPNIRTNDAEVPVDRVPFAQAIDRAQLISATLHTEMETHFDQMRSIVSDYMTTISESVLQRILLAVEHVQAQRVSSSCAVDYEQLGTQISRCSLLVDAQMRQLTGRFYAALGEPQDRSLQVLSGVLGDVASAGSVDSDALVARIDQRIAAMRDRFVGETLPELSEHMEAVGRGRQTMDQLTGDCLQPILDALQC